MFTRGEICVIHVHVPVQNIHQPINGFRAPSWAVRDGALKEQERKVDKMLDNCIKRCARNDVLFENIIFKKESVTDGILELISKLGIRKLVMGAGANNIYLRELEEELQKYRKQRDDVKMELQKYKNQFDEVNMESDDSQKASRSNIPAISG
ncbi:U-box domain-containing protein 33-like isoform X2 [Chenopodium quinoa]|nr:U-box domain-containing protein 33-like isoform X2 [Chenopodium quinoa]